MKKNTWFLILILCVFVLAACAPATNPDAIPTEPAATEAPAEDWYPVSFPSPDPTLVPPVVPSQLVGSMTVRFEMAEGLPTGIFNTDLPVTKRLEFKKVDGQWNKVGLLYPVTNPVDMGRLFLIEWSEPEFSPNSGRVNSYFGEPEGGNSFWPLDETIDEVVTITIRLGLAGCKEDSDNWLVCEIATDDGSLKYWLNGDMNKFIFVMKGNYRLEYETWMVDSLTKLGFTDVALKIPENIVPGGKNTILK